MAKAPIVSKEMYLREAGFDSLPTSWDVVQVEDLLSEDRGISVGVMYPGKHDPNGIPLIKAGDLVGDTISPAPEFRVSQEKHEEYRRTEFQGGEILMTLVGNVGQCAVVPPEMKGWNAARAVAVIRLAEPEDAEFVRHCFLSRQLNHLMNAWANTTVQPTLNLKEIRKLPLPWPPKPERDAIASILGALDDKIELNRRMNATLESLARAIFKSWFVDFDPVKINAGQMPASSQALATHDPKVLDLFPSTFQDSELGPIPEGWTRKSIEDLIGFEGGFAFKSKDWQDEGVPVVKIGSVKPGIIDLSNVSYVSQKLADDSSRYQLGVGDLLIGMTGYVGEVGIVPPAETLPLLNQRVGKFVLPSEGTADLPFWYCVTRSSDFREYVKGRSHGTAQANVSAKGIMSYTVLTPPDSIVSEFNRSLEGVFRNILSNHAENELLARSRDELLPELLSGELPVSAEFLMSEAN